jgi:SAM-dependent methyltransferase
MSKEDFGPYIRFDKSPLWNIHNDYFQSRGLLAWSKGEVPFSGISNYFEAYKKARFLIDNLKQLESSQGELSRIKVLEVGAGYGEFAKNFLYAFREISDHENLNYFQRLKYFITDYSSVNIEQLKASKRLRVFEDKVFFDILDVLNPPYLDSSNPSKHKIWGAGSFDAIFANYLLDQLPARIFAYDGTSFFEKYLSVQNPSTVKNKKKSFIKKLKKKFRFQEIDWQEELSLEHREILFSCFKTNKASTIVYSYGALKAIKNFLYMLKPSGVIICSDFNASAKPGLDSFEPCYYGNSLAQAVNYEFIFKYFLDYSSRKNKVDHKIIGTKFGHQMVLVYEDPIKPLHTFFLTRPDFPQELQLSQTYKNVYQQNWFLRAFYRFIVEMQLGFYILIVFIFAFAFWHYFFKSSI